MFFCPGMVKLGPVQFGKGRARQSIVQLRLGTGVVQLNVLECSGVQVQFSDVHYSSGIVRCCEGRCSIVMVEQRGVRLRDGMVQFSLVQYGSGIVW